MKLVALAVVLTLATPTLSFSAPIKTSVGVITKYVGGVSAKNAEAFMDIVGDHLDKIIGLNVAFDSTSNDKTGYSAELDGRLFTVNFGTMAKPGAEVVVPKAEANYQHGEYILNGFYIVKSGGVHQGFVSYGLEKVDESAVLLSPKYRVLEKSFH